MTKALVGYTGFVGSNILSGTVFDSLYNSKNIEEAFGTRPDILYYSGVRAEKYLANTDPDADMRIIEGAMSNISKISPGKVVLISTIDIYRDPRGADEDTAVELSGLHPYGYNRYMLEKWVTENYSDHLIVRLPGLFGKNIKKNFIYDLINIIPSMIKENKYITLDREYLDMYYAPAPNGFMKLDPGISGEKKRELKSYFISSGFTALDFTDSRSVFQMFDLSRISEVIDTALANGIKLLNVATEPCSAGEIYKAVTGEEFRNELQGKPAYYDFRTRYSAVFGRSDGYIADKAEVLKAIKDFVAGESA